MPNIKRTMMGAAGVSSDPGGSLWAWGSNWSGELGDGTTTHRSSPVQIGALTDWLLATNGMPANWSNPIKNDGTLWVTGANDYGQLGLGDTTNRSSPVQVGALTNWFQAGGGDYQGIAIKTDGTIWSWGRTHYGQGGRNNATDVSSPVQIGSLTDWKGTTSDDLLDGVTKLGVGTANTHVIKSDGTLWAWGWGAQKTGGWGDTSNRSSPVQIGSGTDWASVSAAYTYNTMAVKTGGTLWAWGKGDYGQLGQGNTTDHDSPVQVGALTTWKYGGNGSHWSCAVKTDGTLWAWGRNNKGQLGLGDTTNRSSPVQVGSLTNWLRPFPGYESNRVLKTDGTLWTWGQNTYGQLGLNDTTDRSSPVQVGSVTNWSKIFGGKDYTLAVQLT
tara:strand:+ start:285 stop:1439 length:1155 start_codon:yes stop_codon:yes gene_type:complete